MANIITYESTLHRCSKTKHVCLSVLLWNEKLNEWSWLSHINGHDFNIQNDRTEKILKSININETITNWIGHLILQAEPYKLLSIHIIYLVQDVGHEKRKLLEIRETIITR